MAVIIFKDGAMNSAMNYYIYTYESQYTPRHIISVVALPLNHFLNTEINKIIALNFLPSTHKYVAKTCSFFQASKVVSTLLAGRKQKRNTFCEIEMFNFAQLPITY